MARAMEERFSLSERMATNNHQEKNARILEQAGAVKVITEQEATPELLYDEAWRLLSSPETLKAMGQCARRKAQPDVLERIYQTLKSL